MNPHNDERPNSEAGQGRGGRWRSPAWLAVCFAVFAGVPLWRIGDPLWFDEILYPLAAHSGLAPLQRYLMCNGDLWATVLYSWLDPAWISPWLLRLPQVLAMAAAGTLVVAHVRPVRQRPWVATFWLLYMPVFHYACEGRQFGWLTLAVAVAAVGLARRSWPLALAGSLWAATVSPYGALLGLIVVLVGADWVALRPRVLAGAVAVGVLLWMAEVFPQMPLNYPPYLRMLMMPETRATYTFTVNWTAIRWLVGSEHLWLSVPLAASWLALLTADRRHRLARTAVAISLMQVVAMIAADRVMHIWNMFVWVPLFALVLGRSGRLGRAGRTAGRAIVALLIVNLAASWAFFSYRGPRPMVGIDTAAWLHELRAVGPTAAVVLSEGAPTLGTLLPVLRHAPQQRFVLAPSGLALGTEMRAHLDDWLRPDQTFVALGALAATAPTAWSVFDWRPRSANPCMTVGNPCMAHYTSAATPTTPPKIPDGLSARVQPFRGGYATSFTATPATLRAFLAVQPRWLEPRGPQAPDPRTDAQP